MNKNRFFIRQGTFRLVKKILKHFKDLLNQI